MGGMLEMYAANGTLSPRQAVVCLGDGTGVAPLAQFIGAEEAFEASSFIDERLPMQ